MHFKVPSKYLFVALSNYFCEYIFFVCFNSTISINCKTQDYNSGGKHSEECKTHNRTPLGTLFVLFPQL